MKIFEVITTIPNLNVYFTNREKELRNYYVSLKHNMADFLYFEKNPDNDIKYFDQMMTRLNLSFPSKYILTNFIDKIEQAADNCRNIYTHNLEFLKYFKHNIKILEEIITDDNLVQWISIIEKSKEQLENYFGEPSEPEYQRVYHALNALENISKTVQNISLKIENYKSVLNAIDKKTNYTYNPNSYRPDHEEIENLYHVSLYANDISKNGFKDTKPEEYVGVGNYGNQKKISFTHSLVIAQSILRAFRDIWMIVHGQLKAPEIFSWIKHENIYDEVMKGIGIKNFIPKTTKDILHLYRYYLLHNKLRIDPWIVNLDTLAENIKTVDYKNIGILSCEVKLTGNEEYFDAEREFRVEPNQILSVKKLF
jgi:hypothetical protein